MFAVRVIRRSDCETILNANVILSFIKSTLAPPLRNIAMRYTNLRKFDKIARGR